MWCRLKDQKKPNYCNQLQSLIKIAEIKGYKNILSTASYRLHLIAITVVIATTITDDIPM